MQSVKKSGGNIFGKSPRSAKKRNALICAAALVIVILVVIAFLLLSGSETAYRSISISEVSGRVNAENNGISYAAYKNMVIGGGYALTTEKESYTRMLLDGDKYMKLEEESNAIFESLGSPQSHRTAIRLNYGALSTEITEPLGKGEDYVVNTPNAVLAVRGTFFRVVVSFDTNGDAYTDVYTYGGAVVCHRVMPDGTEVDEEVVVDTGYKARIKMDEIITIYVEELIEVEEDHVDPLEMSDVRDDHLVDVYNASAHGHEMFRSTGELWSEIVEREIDLDDYISVYDGEKIPPYTEDKELEETFVTTPAPETAEKVNPPDNTETQQPESSLLSETTGAEPIPTEASVLPAETTAAEAFAELLPETDSTAAPTGNVAAETVIPHPTGTGEAAPTGRPAETTVPNEITEFTEETEDTEEPEETEEPAPTTTAAETTTTPAWVNPSPSAEIVTRPQAFTTSTPPIPVITTASTEPSHVHTLMEETIAASCTADGIVRTRCSVCGTVVSETILPALGHNTGSVTVAATCEADGERLDVCKLCGVIVSQTIIPATGHIADITTVAATCTSDGERTEQCRICGTVLSTEVIPATGHTEITETAEPTCTENGSTTVKCSVCGEILSEENIPATGHTEVTESDGGIETVKCGVCGEIISQTNTDTGLVYPVALDAERFPDPVFLEYVRQFDTDGDGELSLGECEAVTEIDVSGTSSADGGITSLKGIEYFTGLYDLYCNYNNGLTEFDVGQNTALKTLCCSSTSITSLDVRNNVALTGLDCSNTQIAMLDISQNTALTVLECFHIQITELDVSQNTALLKLNCSGTQITSLDVSQSTLLTHLYCFYTNLTSLDVRNNTELTELYCYDTQITALDVSQNTALEYLDCHNCNLAYIDVSGNPLLTTFNATRNKQFIHVIGGSFDTNTIAGFDPSRVLNVKGADWDSDTCILNGIAEDIAAITYTYDCDGAGGHNVTFTLVPDGNSTFDTVFDGTIYMDDGSVTITSTGFTQGSSPEETFWTGDYVITQRNSSAEITAYIDVKGTHNITFDGLNLCYYGMVVHLEGNITVKGTSNKNIFVCKKIDGLDSHGIIYTGLYCGGDIVFESGIIETDSIDYSIYISKTFGNSHPIIDGASITALNKVFINSSLDTLTLNSGILNVRNVRGSTASTGFGTMYVNGGLATIDSERYIIGKKGIIMGGSMCFVPNTNTNGEITNAFGDELECVVYDTFPSEAERTFVNSDGSAYVYSLNEGDCADDGKYYIWKPKAAPKGVAVNEENFPDEIFRNYVAENFDTDGDGYLSKAEIEAVRAIEVAGSYLVDGGITSMKGVEYFPKLTVLDFEYNKGVTEIDVSQNAALKVLRFGGQIEKHTPPDYPITSIDISKNFELTELWCRNALIDELDVSQHTSLTVLSCAGIPITSLDVSNNRALESLDCGNTQITSLDVSNNTALKTLRFYNVQITSIDVSKNTALEILECVNTRITSLDVSKNTALIELYCTDTPITSLDVSQNTVLEILDCVGSQLAFIDISGNLFDLCVDQTYHPITVTNGSFDTHTITGFDPTRVSDVVGAEWDEATGVFSGITEGTDISYTYDCDGAGGHNVTFTLVPDEESTFAPEDVEINEENFPDENFRTYVTTRFDTDRNGYLSEEECSAVTEINVGGTSSADGGITSLKGIEYFPELIKLYCQYNSGLTVLDVSQNTALQTLYCGSIQITELDVSNNTALTDLYCYGTSITVLDIRQNTALEVLHCYNNPITALDVSQNTALRTLSCGDTQITALDVSKNTELKNLNCYNTQIAVLDVSNNTALKVLNCYYTQITALDVSNNTALEELKCNSTRITALDVSQNAALNYLSCRNSKLAYIDVSNNPSLSTFDASDNQYPIPADALSFDVSIIEGFDPNRVSNVQGANFNPASGIFDNFTSDTITYTYDCDGAGGHNVTFTLVRSDEAVGASLSGTDIPASGEGAFPFGGAEVFSLLPPVGFLALAHNRKRKTAFRFAKKAEIN